MPPHIKQYNKKILEILNKNIKKLVIIRDRNFTKIYYKKNIFCFFCFGMFWYVSEQITNKPEKTLFYKILFFMVSKQSKLNYIFTLFLYTVNTVNSKKFTFFYGVKKAKIYKK